MNPVPELSRIRRSSTGDGGQGPGPSSVRQRLRLVVRAGTKETTLHEESNEVSPRTLQSLRTGHIEALEEIYLRYSTRVRRLCCQVLGNDIDADDAVTEVFLRAFEQAEKFSGRSRFSTWLHRLAVNHCLNLIESRRKRISSSLALLKDSDHPKDPAPSPLESAIRGEERHEVDQLLDGLASQSRVILVLREIEELSYAEIAEVLEIPIGTVMSRLSRSREKLVRRLEQMRRADDPGGVE